MNRSRFLGRSGYGSYSSYLPTSTTSISYSSYLSRPGGLSSYSGYGGSNSYSSVLSSPRRRYGGALTDSSNLTKEKTESTVNPTTSSTSASSTSRLGGYRGARSHVDLLEGSKSSNIESSTEWQPRSSSRFSSRMDDLKSSETRASTKSYDWRRSTESNVNSLRARSASRGRELNGDVDTTNATNSSTSVAFNRNIGVTSRLVRSSSYGELSQRGVGVGVGGGEEMEEEPVANEVKAPVRSRRARQRHQTLTFGVSPDDLRRSKDIVSEFDDALANEVKKKSNACSGFHSEMSAAVYEPGHSLATSVANSNVMVMPKSILRKTSNGRGSRKSGKKNNDEDDQGYDSRRASLSSSSSQHISALTVAALEREARLVSYISALRKEMDSVLPMEKNSDLDNMVASSVATNSQSSSAFKESSARAQASQLNPDYKKLWEESQRENAKLRDDIRRIKEELINTRRQLETAKLSGASADGKDRLLLEKKLNEMEEELKLLAFSENLVDQQLEQLRSDNQRLRDENVALVRVISKLSR